MDRIILNCSRPADLQNVREIRQLLRRVLQLLPTNQQLVNSVEICYTEIVTNIIDHGGDDVSIFCIVLKRSEFSYTLEVFDDGSLYNPFSSDCYEMEKVKETKVYRSYLNLA